MRRVIPRMPDHRDGMTLIELLVVVAILGLLAVTVLPNLANTAEARRSREASRVVSSFIAKSQSRAIGRSEWSGCTFVPVGTTGTQGFAVLDMFLADVPARYRGETTDAAVKMSGTFPNRRVMTATAGGLTGAAARNVSRFDLIRFDGRGPWYELTDPPGATTLEIRLLGYEDSDLAEDLGYVARNTPWPADTQPHTFEILRRPVPAGSPLSLAGGRAIDLFWSGFGPPLVGSMVTYVRFTTPGQPISLLFDGSGRLRQILGPASAATGSPRWVPTGPVFILVGRADRAGQASATLNPADDSVGANWQYSDSFWIGVDVVSGVCKTAECRPNASDVIDSQLFIRQALLKGGS